MELDTIEIKEKILSLIEEKGYDPEKDKKLIANELNLTLKELKEVIMKDRQDRLLRKAEQTAEELLNIDLDDPKNAIKYGKNKLDIMKMKLKEAEFIRSTLGKDVGYSSRSEITGKDGEEIRIKEIIFTAPVMPPIITPNGNK